MTIDVLAPMSVEAHAVRSGAPWAQVHTTGMGPRRAARSAAEIGDRYRSGGGGTAVLLAGFCGALDPALQPGDVVLASELRDPAGTVTRLADPSILAGALRRGGMRVHVAPVASSAKVVRGEMRGRLRATGAIAADMESAWLAPAAQGRPFVTLRVVLDTGERELHRPLRTLSGFATAYRALRQACGLAGEWTRALGERELRLASPRASCAGVDRAIEIVEAVLVRPRRTRLRPPPDRPQRPRRQLAAGTRRGVRRGARRGAPGRDRHLLRPWRLAGGAPRRRRPGARRDRRHLPARGQGPRRGAAIRRARFRHRARRPRGPRGGGGHARRGPPAHPRDRDRRGGRRARGGRPGAGRLPDCRRRSRSTRRPASSMRCAPAFPPRSVPPPPTSAMRPRTARTPCVRWPPTVS